MFNNLNLDLSKEVIRKEIICHKIDDLNYFFDNQDNHLLLAYLNIRSLDKHHEELQVLLHSLNTKPDIIICAETWNCRNPNLYDIERYKLHINNSSINKADGVAMYVKSSLEVNITNIALNKTVLIEAQITANENKKITISAIYRSKEIKKESFIADLKNYLSTKKNLQNHYIVGDININILDTDEQAEEYINNYNEAGYLSIINSITRPNTSGGTCIDHIFAKEDTETKAIPYVYQNNISDHYSLFFQLKTKLNNNINNKITDYTI